MRIYQSTFDILKPMPPFKSEMRKANRENRKTQTRRVMDPQPYRFADIVGNNDLIWKDYSYPVQHFSEQVIKHCKYGKSGEIRYMREPIYNGFGGVAFYQDDDVMVLNILTGEPITWRWKKDTLSGLYMPKEAARTFKQYEFIRVEHVQEIEFGDVSAEGVTRPQTHYPKKYAEFDEFVKLWNSINAKRGYGWDINPWVWVIGYKPFEMSEISVINSNMEVGNGA